MFQLRDLFCFYTHYLSICSTLFLPKNYRPPIFSNNILNNRYLNERKRRNAKFCGNFVHIISLQIKVKFSNNYKV